MKLLNYFVSTAKVINQRPFLIKAELTRSQKEKVDGWVRKFQYHRYDGWQDEAFGGRHSGRKVIKLEGVDKPIPIPHEVSQALKQANISVVDYAKGIGKDSYGRQIKIGKILKRFSPSAAKVFDEDKNRQGVKTANYQVVLSRLPYDVAGMSTDRGWTSCQDMSDNRGMNKALMYDLKNGTVVAYLTKEGDDEIKNPTARISLKPYYAARDPDGILKAESTMYGSTSPDLEDQFRKAIFSWQNEHFKPDPDKTYRLSKGVYNDSLPTRILSNKARRKFFQEIAQFSGGNLSRDFENRRILADSLSKASVAELLAIGDIPSLRNILSTVPVGKIPNLKEAIDKDPSKVLGFYDYMDDVQKEKVSKNLPPLQLYNFAVNGNNSKGDILNYKKALEGMTEDSIKDLGTDFVNQASGMLYGIGALPESESKLKSDVCKNILLKSPSEFLDTLLYSLADKVSKDFLKNREVRAAFNKAGADRRLLALSVMHEKGDYIPESIKSKAIKEAPASLKKYSGRDYLGTSLGIVSSLEKLAPNDTGKAAIKKIIKSAIRHYDSEGSYLPIRLAKKASENLDREDMLHAFGKMNPNHWYNGFNKDAIVKHKLENPEVEHVENKHRDGDDLLKLWIHKQINPTQIENKFFMRHGLDYSDKIKKIAYNRIKYLERKHNVTASMETNVKEVLEAFQVTANTSLHPVKEAEKQASSLTKQEKSLESKIQKDAQRNAAKGGHKPSNNPEEHKAYQAAVDHHIAHHPDIKKLGSLKTDAAKARVAHKRLLRQNKTQASSDIPDAKEAKAFYKRASEAEAHHAKSVKDLTAQREENSKNADHHFSKMMNDADKKAHAHATKLGHKKGSAGYKKAFSDVHMDHFLAHPDNEKHNQLLHKGNQIYGKLKKAQNEHKFAKLNLKNATKLMKHHGIAIPKKKKT